MATNAELVALLRETLMWPMTAELEERIRAVLPPETTECRSCGGYGTIKEPDGARRKCLDCRGSGAV